MIDALPQVHRPVLQLGPNWISVRSVWFVVVCPYSLGLPARGILEPVCLRLASAINLHPVAIVRHPFAQGPRSDFWL